jgi:5,10-methenyltetrahydrofolate synthetase
VDPEQARDVARWRKVERERLIAARRALTEEYRREQTLAIARAVERILATLALPTLSVYWPIRAEPDLRPWMGTLLRQGMRVALPVAIALGQPLVFREWRPHARLARGLWNIPYPADGAEVVPNVVIAPLVGFDPQCYRLGYGAVFLIAPSRRSCQNLWPSVWAIRARRCRPRWTGWWWVHWIRFGVRRALRGQRRAGRRVVRLRRVSETSRSMDSERVAADLIGV